MKNLSRVLLAVVLVALSVVAAQAQSRVMLKGDVPFAFNVGDKQLPAGKYEVQSINHELEGWYDAKGKGLFFLGTTPMGKEASIDTTKLVFRRYGDEYFLIEVWSQGQSHQVRTNAKEQRLAKSQPYETIALVAEAGR